MGRTPDPELGTPKPSAQTHGATETSGVPRAPVAVAVGVSPAGSPAPQDAVSPLIAHDTDGAVSPTAVTRPLTASTPPKRISRYQIDSMIARGGFGAVYRARHLLLGYPGAIKVLRQPIHGDARAFRDEARRLARLHGHPGVVQIRDFGLYRDDRTGERHPYFVTDLVPGELTLLRHIDAVEAGLGERLRLMSLVCDAVQHAHDHRLLHLDLKPDNILVWPASGSRPAQPKLIDLGIARPIDASVEPVPPKDHRSIRGTPEYMAPEQTNPSAPLDERTDVRGLGAVLFEMLVGRRVFQQFEGNAQQLLELIRTCDVDLDAPDVRTLPASVRAIMARALARDPSERYPSARAMGDDLRRVLRGEHPSAIDPSPSRLTRTHRRIARFLAHRPVSGFALASVTALLFTAFVAIPALFVLTSSFTRYDNAMAKLAGPPALKSTAAVDVPLASVPGILGLTENGQPVENPEPWRRREVIARTLNAWCDMAPTAGRPAAIGLDFFFMGSRPPDADLLAAIERAERELAPVVLNVRAWEFGPDGTPAPDVLAPTLARSNRRLAIAIGDDTRHEVSSVWQVILASEFANAETAPTLALAAVVATMHPTDRAEYAVDRMEAGVTVRPYRLNAAGLRRYVTDEPLRFPASGVYYSHEALAAPTRSDEHSARLFVPVPTRAALDAVTIPVVRLVNKDHEAARALADKIVFFGDTSIVADQHPIGKGETLPGIAAHLATAEILRGEIPSRPSIAGQWLVLIVATLIGVTIPFALERRHPFAHRLSLGLGVIACAGAAVVLALAAVAAGTLLSVVVNPLVPIAALVAGACTMLVLVYWARSHPFPLVETVS